MPVRRSPFRQIDIERAIKAAKAAGIVDYRVELEPSGKLVLVAGAAAGISDRNSFDGLMEG
jgi:hypothetical protein